MHDCMWNPIIFRLTYVFHWWQDGEFMEELDDFEAFVRTIGGLVNSGAQVDIVQLGTGISIKWIELHVAPVLGMFWLHLYVSSLGRIARVLSPEESHNLSSAETQQVVFSTAEPRPYSRASHGYHHAPRCGRDGSFSVPLFAHTHRQWRRAD